MQYKDDLKAYLDGELSPQRTEEIRLQLETNAELAEELRRLKAVGDSLRRRRAEYEPVGLDATLHALAADARIKTPNRRMWIGYLSGGLIAGAALLCYAWVNSRTGVAASASLVAMKQLQPEMDHAHLPAPTGLLDQRLRRDISRRQFASKAATAKTDQAWSPEQKIVEMQKTIDQLKQENANLRANPLGAEGAHLFPPISGKFPAHPSSPVQPGVQTVGLGDGATATKWIEIRPSLSPSAVAKLEQAVRQLVAKQPARVLHSSGKPNHRELLIELDPANADMLVTRLRHALGSAGTVVLTPPPAVVPSQDELTATDKIRDLKVERDRVLETYLPEAPQVKDLDSQIAELEKSLPKRPPSKATIKVTIG